MPRPDDEGLQIISGLESYNLLALTGLDAFILRIERAFILAAAQIGHANPGNHSAVEVVGRKSARTAQHNARDASLRKRLPERHALALVHNLRRRKQVFRPLKPA